MALGPSTFTDLGGAVSDIFSGLSAETQAQLKAQGLQIESEGTQITAQADLLKAQGDIAEGQEYGLAQTLAEQNESYTAASTAIQSAQQERQVSMTIGSQKAAIGGSGLAESGSALDLMRNSAQQGALANGVLQMQGQITKAGYAEQAASYGIMQSAAQNAATTETTMAGEEENIATQQQQLASETAAAGSTAEFGNFAGALLQGAASVATLVAAPATAGASLALPAAALTSTGALY